MKHHAVIMTSLLLLTLASGLAAATPTQETQVTTVQQEALRIDLNAADATALEQLPGVGKTVAMRIVNYRAEHGRFNKVEEIMNVKGIGEKTFLRLRPFIFVDQKESD